RRWRGKSGALPTELRASTPFARAEGATGGARTHLPRIHGPVLYLLSYGRHTPARSCDDRSVAGGSVPPSALVVAFAPEPGASRPAGPPIVNFPSSPITSGRKRGARGKTRSPRPRLCHAGGAIRVAPVDG